LGRETSDREIYKTVLEIYKNTDDEEVRGVMEQVIVILLKKGVEV